MRCFRTRLQLAFALLLIIAVLFLLLSHSHAYLNVSGGMAWWGLFQANAAATTSPPSYAPVLPPSSYAPVLSPSPYIPFLPPPLHTRRSNNGSSVPILPSRRETLSNPFWEECGGGRSASNNDSSNVWQTCDAAACAKNFTQKFKPIPRIALPGQTVWGENTRDFIQRVLQSAWGANPPRIDLYLRAGCRGALELHYLFESIALFWPAHLGDIILVLDWNDRQRVDEFVPPSVLPPRFSLHLVYEHQPCLPGRLFNQYSYLNAYRYSSAEYLVTIDSDCVFHRAVTPDVLFNARGQLILATNQNFQSTAWKDSQFYFTQVDDGEWGHSMVTQPIAFRVDTLSQYLAHIAKTRNTCYEDVLTEYYHEQQRRGIYNILFCWMCQVSTYVASQNLSGYDVHVTNKRWNEPFIRYAAHVMYEMVPKHHQTHGYKTTRYHDSAAASMRQGLCFWFGERVFAECEEEQGSEYLHQLMFNYAKFDLNAHSSHAVKQRALEEARDRLHVHVFA